ncbi:hypothetical protein DM01DRAFT_1406549 [Hesseltinella vesiculosa]|uniref:Zn(2)-C6 fungal-type domain-containing protein n=1 Tax=Hesseltinella vesiculosa TaxID=101127 RepID=A0A1X2GKN9_9FUNG|nr:hypothetical protein DM01DRAFT_1406549 [Hesseltinella vesiculosa]
MASMFVSDNSGMQQQKSNEPSRPKRPRSSLACIRCRKKKVKCDFVQPTCGRCNLAGLPCSYATPPRRVDGHAFDQLGNHVEELKERMQKMQSELAMMKTNLHPFSNSITGSSADDNGNMLLNSHVGNHMMLGQPSNDMYNPASSSSMAVMNPNLTSSSALASTGSQQPVTWKLSLSPSGLRIDTNIASVADLYRILLNGISQLNINSDSATSLFSTDSIRSGSISSSSTNNTPNERKFGKSSQQGMDTSTASPMMSSSNNGNMMNMTASAGNGGRLWEVDDKEARQIQQEQYQQHPEDTMAPDTLNQLMHSCYHQCFLAYQLVDNATFLKHYSSDNDLDPLLANSINAWMSKHGVVYHNAGLPGHGPTKMGESYFKNARQLLKKCFDISSPVTIHALLNLYMYQLSSERSSLAYLYIGLAIRMAQDLKYHKKEHMPNDPVERETNKRLWWSAYWLDLCAALESNRPTMVDDKDCDLEYPTKLDSEDDETGFRIDFCVHSIKLMKIRKDITKHLPSEQSGQSLLSAISRLENALTNWLNELPKYLRFDYDDVFEKSGSFMDEAKLILNIQYQTTWIMLHKFFLPKKDQTATPVALLSLNICTKSANFITKILDLYEQHLPWCQFFYALDGVIASVAIHQVNALSNEKELAFLAQRNLIMTVNVLRSSPLVYMGKVNDIIDSIETFLSDSGLPTNINDIPPINEDSANQQSISSVFHPAMFDSNANADNAPHQVPPSSLSSPPQPPVSSTPSSQATFNLSASPQPVLTSQHSTPLPSQHMPPTGIPAGMGHPNVPPSSAPQQPLFPPVHTSSIPMTPSPQSKLDAMNKQQPSPSMYGNPLQQVMDPSQMMFSDSMMGMDASSFFQSMQNTFSSNAVPSPNASQFASSTPNQPPVSQPMPGQQSHHQPPPPGHDMSGMFGGNMFGLDQGLYGNSGNPYFMQQQQHQPQVSQPPQPQGTPGVAPSSAMFNRVPSTNAPANNMYSSTPPSTAQQPQSMDGLLSMDPEAMNAFLQYNAASFSNFGYPQQQQQGQQQQPLAMMTPDMMFAATRKRQRDWDEQNGS